ncbi:MAG: hypothetical protein BroJett040_07430 [Oligoflexia bacterium]|nr:MAG: hypothetical protein BroJett040_07430 [Oligoflexia bacterium]
MQPEAEWKTDVANALQGPSMEHWFGTDSLGRDLFLRTFYGARISLLLGCLSSLCALLIGLCYGSFAAWKGSWYDQIMMRSLEIFQSLPQMITIGLLVLFLGAKVKSSEGILMIFKLTMAISFGSWMLFAKLSRNLTLREKALPYVEAARAMGASSRRIFFRHILPNISTSLLVMMGMQIPNFLLFESILSFIGLGIQPPQSSWGILLQEGWKTLSVYPHLILFPAAILFLTVFSLNFVFDHFRLQLQKPFGSEVNQ